MIRVARMSRMCWMGLRASVLHRGVGPILRIIVMGVCLMGSVRTMRGRRGLWLVRLREEEEHQALLLPVRL